MANTQEVNGMVKVGNGFVFPEYDAAANGIVEVYDSSGLKIVSDYTPVGGDIIYKSKTYNWVREDASNQAIYATYEAIADMQAHPGVKCIKASQIELVKEELLEAFNEMKAKDAEYAAKWNAINGAIGEQNRAEMAKRLADERAEHPELFRHVDDFASGKATVDRERELKLNGDATEVDGDNDIVTTKTLIITFIKTDNSNHNMSIPEYKTGISDQDIARGAGEILSGNIFAPKGLDLIKVDHAQRVDKTITKVPIA